MQKLWYSLVWLSRIFATRGFGIQSPTDYRFARYVVAERWPYYAYGQFKELHDKWLTRKIGRLCFRVANYRQPSVVQSARYLPYLRAGARKASIVGQADVIELAIVASPQEAASLLPRCNSRSVVIVDRIDNHREAWQRLAASPETGVCFDLYFCGIVLFDKTRDKQLYKINF